MEASSSLRLRVSTLAVRRWLTVFRCDDSLTVIPKKKKKSTNQSKRKSTNQSAHRALLFLQSKLLKPGACFPALPVLSAFNQWGGRGGANWDQTQTENVKPSLPPISILIWSFFFWTPPLLQWIATNDMQPTAHTIIPQIKWIQWGSVRCERRQTINTPTI